VPHLIHKAARLWKRVGRVLPPNPSDVASLWNFYKAYQRFQDPPEILGGWMTVVAVVGLLVNVAGTVVLSRSAGENLNMQGP
jgi:hypothetical protein